MKSIKWLQLLTFTIIVYSFLIIISGFYNLKDSITLIPTKWWLLSVLFPIISHLILSIRWFYLLKYLHQSISYLQSLKIYLAGLALIAAPARSAEVIRSIWLFKRHNISIANGISITISERITDLISALLLIILCIGNVPIIISLIFILPLLNYLITLNLTKIILTKIIRFIYNIIPFSKTYASNIGLNKEIFKSLKQTRLLVQPIPLNTSIFLVSLSWLLESFLLYLTFQYLNLQISFEQSILIRTSMGIGGAISLLPAGLLTSESASIALSLAYGANKIQAFTATLFIRVYTLFIPTLIGLISLFLQKDLNSNSNKLSTLN